MEPLAQRVIAKASEVPACSSKAKSQYTGVKKRRAEIKGVKKAATKKGKKGSMGKKVVEDGKTDNKAEQHVEEEAVESKKAWWHFIHKSTLTVNLDSMLTTCIECTFISNKCDDLNCLQTKFLLRLC